MFWKRKDTAEAAAEDLYAALKLSITQDGRIRVEDLVSAAAAIVAEAVIMRAGNFDPRGHAYAPGTRIFSTDVNKLLCDDKSLADAPASSVVGDLRDRLGRCGFVPSDFPNLEDIFRYFAANIGKKEDWGRAPLSVGHEHYPFAQPLRVAYESRAMVDRAFARLGNDATARLRAGTAVLAKALCETRNAIARTVSITLALETVNGMAKTAPMTDAAMAKIVESTRSAKT